MESALAPQRLRALPSWLVTQVATVASRLVGDGLAVAAAHRYHVSILAALDEFGPASQAALGRRCGIDRSDMVAAVTELVSRGLVERAPDRADRRRNVVTVTPAGRRQLRQFDAVLATIQDELLAPLSADERAQLVGLLVRVLDHHSR